MTQLSAIIITLNEAEHIGACLESIAWADEIIVVDAGSQDDTVAICQRYTNNVMTTDWPGFGPQKNRALAQATGNWVLSIDADERVTPALRTEIQQQLATPSYDAYRIPRRSNYCGRWMRHSGFWPDYVLRLFRREGSRFSDDLVHERVITSNAVGTLKEPLLHYPFQNLDEVLNKVNAYSSAGAIMRHQRNQTGGLGRAISHGLWAFLRTYLLRAGFLDGREGFMLAVSNAEGVYYRYLKLMLLQKNPPAVNSAAE